MQDDNGTPGVNNLRTLLSIPLTTGAECLQRMTGSQGIMSTWGDNEWDTDEEPRVEWNPFLPENGRN